MPKRTTVGCIFVMQVKKRGYTKKSDVHKKRGGCISVVGCSALVSGISDVRIAFRGAVFDVLAVYRGTSI